MRRLSVVTVFVTMAMAVVGCGTADEYQFTRDQEPADVVEMKVSAGEQDFVWQAPVSSATSEQNMGGNPESALDSCSGSCTNTTCTCYGTYECCRQGCNFCWEQRDL